MAGTSLTTTPTTLLEAINALMRSVGLSEVVSLLDADGNLDSANAFSAINHAGKNIQAQGWYGNTEDMTFPPNSEGNILLPNNALEVRPQRGTSSWVKHLSDRNGKLYDLDNHTFTFSTTEYLEVVQALAFEEMPQALRWYVTCAGGRLFGTGTYPTSATFQFTADAEANAKALALQEDERLRDGVLTETSPFFGRMRRR